MKRAENTKDHIVSLSKSLITIQSHTDNSKGLEDVLETTLSHLSEYSIERFEKNGVKSALIYNRIKRSKKFKILLNAHLDVVPGKTDNYTPKVEGDKLYGVGALDMKSNAACMILVFKELAKKITYPLALQLTTDEEVGGFNGTKYQIEKGVRADFVIAGETTNFDIVNKSKGVLWIKVSSKGTSAHGAYPWRGKNAIWKMNQFLNDLQKQYPTPKREQWTTTINLSRIETSNQAMNKIPDDCEVWLDIRYISEDNREILKNLKKLLPKNFKFKILVNEPAKLVDEKNPYIQLLSKAAKQIINKNIILRGAHGSSDARHFNYVGCDGVEFGAIGGGIGSDEEYISIKSLEQYYKILKEFLLSLN